MQVIWVIGLSMIIMAALDPFALARGRSFWGFDDRAAQPARSFSCCRVAGTRQRSSELWRQTVHDLAPGVRGFSDCVVAESGRGGDLSLDTVGWCDGGWVCVWRRVPMGRSTPATIPDATGNRSDCAFHRGSAQSTTTPILHTGRRRTLLHSQFFHF